MPQTLAARDIGRRPYQGMETVVFSALSADVITRNGDPTVVWLDGEHDFSTLPVLIDVLTRAISAGDADLVVDLSGVTFIGVATIDELVRCRNRLGLQSRTLTLRSPSRFARRLLNLCGLADTVEP